MIAYINEVRQQLADWNNDPAGRSFGAVIFSALDDHDDHDLTAGKLVALQGADLQQTLDGDIVVDFVTAWKDVGQVIAEAIEFGGIIPSLLDQKAPCGDWVTVTYAVGSLSGRLQDREINTTQVVRSLLVPAYANSERVERLTRYGDDFRRAAFRKLVVHHQDLYPRPQLLEAIEAACVRLVILQNRMTELESELGINCSQS